MPYNVALRWRFECLSLDLPPLQKAYCCAQMGPSAAPQQASHKLMFPHLTPKITTNTQRIVRHRFAVITYMSNKQYYTAKSKHQGSR